MGKDHFFKNADWPVVLGMLLALAVNHACSRSADGQVPRKLSLSRLPAPPAELQKLLAAGRVRFEVGPRKTSGDARIIGETRYEISYRYKSQATWRLSQDPQGMRVLAVNVVFRDVQWYPKHVIWLRNQPDAELFWSDPILLHEIDHLRISTDPGFAKRFAELLEKRRVIRHTLLAGEFAGRELTDRLVEQEVQKVFEEVTDLIAIRYRELDRETLHGRKPLPTSSRLYDLLRSKAESGSLNSDGNTSGNQ